MLHAPWPDFLTFYATPATGAGWIVPKTYTEKIGTDTFKNQPVGLGPYRFVSYNPGVELELEANPDYWRKTPSVKRLVLKSVPEASTRLAMLKNQEADVTYGIYQSFVQVPLNVNQTVIVVVDSYDTYSAGPYTLNVW